MQNGVSHCVTPSFDMEFYAVFTNHVQIPCIFPAGGCRNWVSQKLHCRILHSESCDLFVFRIVLWPCVCFHYKVTAYLWVPTNFPKPFHTTSVRMVLFCWIYYLKMYLNQCFRKFPCESCFAEFMRILRCFINEEQFIAQIFSSNEFNGRNYSLLLVRFTTRRVPNYR